MNRFASLIRVLDGIRSEAEAARHTRLYATDSSDQEAIWQARARAYVHLYLKVMFGIREFSDREQLVTDGSFDGGIDGYYIDRTSKRIYLIQSKLRRSEEGFEGTPISVHEILAMQVRRVLGGEELDECGETYNGKILGLQRNFRDIVDQGRYKIIVIILANVAVSYSTSDLRRLTDGYDTQVFDFKRAYKDLLLPVVSGNLFRAQEISIQLDSSNKSAGSKISYDAGDGVNRAVRQTVLKRSGNDFALLNNGITIICDESGISEQSGRKHKAQLYLRNPQIINGGQTAYTLSLVYDETSEDDREAVFAGQEVLVKAIALTPSNSESGQETKRRNLIERISTATNSQTAVSYADRVSGDDNRLEAQAALYEHHGVLVEFKRGEYTEGVRAGYIAEEDVVERSIFQRLYFVANGRFSASLRKRIIREPFPGDVATDMQKMHRFNQALILWKIFTAKQSKSQHYTNLLLITKIAAALRLLDTNGTLPLHEAAKLVNLNWNDFSTEVEGSLKSRSSRIVARSTSPTQPEVWFSRIRLAHGHGSLEEEITTFFAWSNLSAHIAHRLELMSRAAPSPADTVSPQT